MHNKCKHFYLRALNMVYCSRRYVTFACLCGPKCPNYKLMKGKK